MNTIGILMLDVPAFRHANEQAANDVKPLRDAIDRVKRGDSLVQVLDVPALQDAARQAARDVEPLMPIIKELMAR